MEPIDRDMLRKVLELSEENNRMVHKLYRSWWWGRVGKIVYWVIVLGIIFGAFYFLQPYIDRIGSTIEQFQSSVDTVKNVVVGN